MEEKAPELAKALTTTLATHDKDSLWQALKSAVRLYGDFQTEFSTGIILRDKAKAVALRTLNEERQKLGS